MDTILLHKIKVGEHFMLQNVEYERLEEHEEDGGIYCKNLKDGSSGILSRDRQVMKVEPQK
jgi:hypothetical protein